MEYVGKVRIDKRTKDLVKRLRPGEIAVIDHEDMDRVSAESLVAADARLVINAAPSVSGAYPNVGPLLLVSGGVPLLDNVGQKPFEQLREGQTVSVDEHGTIYAGSVGASPNPASDKAIATGVYQTVERLEAARDEATKNLGVRLDEFAHNTLSYLNAEKNIIADDLWVPPITTPILGRHVLVVVRGYHFKEDLDVLKSYIREVKPVLIGVDGGADAILDLGFKPDIIIGDMDSVSDAALGGGSELIVHAYADGRAPGLDALTPLGLSEYAHVWPLTATSEDLALLLAFELGADLIVAVGTHNNLVEYLDKGRAGMASSFLVRLKVGPKLVDAKGVNQLYRSSISAGALFPIVIAAVCVIAALVAISPGARSLFLLLVLRLRMLIGL
jgi:uncharacterized membrane-anchored protein